MCLSFGFCFLFHVNPDDEVSVTDGRTGVITEVEDDGRYHVELADEDGTVEIFHESQVDSIGKILEHLMMIEDLETNLVIVQPAGLKPTETAMK